MHHVIYRDLAIFPEDVRAMGWGRGRAHGRRRGRKGGCWHDCWHGCRRGYWHGVAGRDLGWVPGIQPVGALLAPGEVWRSAGA